jgi:anti-sigma B factor antagonist
MPIAVRSHGDVRIIELKGEFTLDAGGLVRPLDLRGQRVADLGETLRRVLDQGCRKLLLDLEKVTFLDSAGLGELVASRKRTLERGGDIHLLRPVGKVRDLLEILCLNRMFRIFDDEDLALASFAGELQSAPSA